MQTAHCHQGFSMATNRSQGCGQPVNRCSFLQFCGIALREMMNNLKSKWEMMTASFRDEVNKYKCVSSLFFPPPLFLHSQSHGTGGNHQTYLRSTSLETPQGCVHVHVCVHAHIQARRYARKRVMPFKPLLYLSFFFASLFLSLDARCISL